MNSNFRVTVKGGLDIYSPFKASYRSNQLSRNKVSPLRIKVIKYVIALSGPLIP